MDKKKVAGSRSRKLLGIGAAVAVLCIAGAAWWFTGGTEVSAALAEQKDVVKLVSETGTIQSKNAVQVVAKSGGQVGEIYVEEGDLVSKDQLLLLSDASSAAMDVAGIQAQAAGVRAQYNMARELADKNKKLYEEGVISHDVYLQSETAAKQLAAQLSSLGYNAASVKKATGGGKIKAPIAGVVTQVYAKEGEMLQPGAPILELSGVDDSYGAVNLIAEDADLVKVDMKVILYNDKDEVLCSDASVSKVALKAQNVISELGISQKRVAVEIALPKGNGLRLGTETDVKIEIEKKAGALTVPEKAVFEWDSRDCVYVVEKGKAVLRDVELGLEGKDDVEILSGLVQGEAVILSPGAEIEDGTRVKIK